MDFPDKPPATWNEFYQLMLTGSVGNRIVREVNNLALKKGYNSDIFMKINTKAVEKIYGVVLNEIKMSKTAKDNEWKLVKIGMTGKQTKKGTNNRMEQVMSAIEAESSVLFSLLKGFTDTTSIFEVEKRVRGHMGFSLNKEITKKMSLPCSTEWILTTQSYINVLLSKMKEKRDAGEWCTTQIFNDFSITREKYRKDSLPDGFVMDMKRNEIVLSSPGQLPDWLNDELERFETEKRTRPYKSIESGISDETATTSYAPTPGQKKIQKTKTDTTAQTSKEVPVSKCPPTPKEAVTEASPKQTGRKTASSEDTGTKNAIPSSPEGTKTGSSGKGQGKKTTTSLPEGGRTERRNKGREKKSSPSLPETSTER